MIVTRTLTLTLTSTLTLILTLALTLTLTLTRYALSEGRFLPASCDGSRGGQVRPEERDEEAERLAGPQPSDGSDG